MTLFVTFVSEKNVSSIFKEGFRPSQERRNNSTRLEVEQKQQEVLRQAGFDVETENGPVYGAVFNEENLHEVENLMRLHGTIGIIWSDTEKCTLTMGDSLVGENHRLAYNKPGYAENLITEMLSCKRSFSTAYVEFQQHDPDLSAVRFVVAHKRSALAAEAAGTDMPKWYDESTMPAFLSWTEVGDYV